MVARSGSLGQDVKFFDQLIGEVFHGLEVCVLQAGVDQPHPQRLVVQNPLDRRRQTRADRPVRPTDRSGRRCTDDGTPPTRVATAGQPNDRASTKVRGVPSDRLGSTKTSWLR